MKIQVILDLDIADHGLESVIDHAARSYVENITRFPHHFDFGQIGTFIAEIERAEICSPGFFDAAAAAVRTLEAKAYTYHGGEQWRPPLGKMPDYLAEPPSPSDLAAAPEVPRAEAKSPESSPIDSQRQSDCPYSVGDVLRRILAGGKTEEWRVVEIVGDQMELWTAETPTKYRGENWRELEASPEWELYKAAVK